MQAPHHDCTTMDPDMLRVPRSNRRGFLCLDAFLKFKNSCRQNTNKNKSKEVNTENALAAFDCYKGRSRQATYRSCEPKLFPLLTGRIFVVI